MACPSFPCPKEVERTVAVRAEDPGGDDDDECNKAEAEAVRGLLEHASEGRLGVFLLVNMDGDDGLGVPGHGGRGIGAP
ncbi:hypothetical protein OCS_06104 [Ophiocordyceps sinensis CO18]|uniref:Uncharacterized protein n=1 Tax=Ophiocordyceps sinensis (strain Co18 / CGMCC 3.14243) TaxID=911162 RepID=T4ZYH3_OPHSC|nr:hypothetical protein OCS_06104 [Ophiocordyceps sinensis CO18]